MPNDRPPAGRLLLFGFQHILTMFPATVFGCLLCGFHVSTVLLAAGTSTIVALLLSRRAVGTFIPLFYGSSFSYIAAYQSLAQAMGHRVQFGVPLPDEVIAVLQTGIIATGVLNVVVGLLVHAAGKRALDRVLPPIVTGSVACVIGFGLSKSALEMSLTTVPGYWAIALFTLLATVGFSHLLRGRGLLGMLPVLLGAVSGYLLTWLVAPSQIVWATVRQTPFLVAPHLTWPALTGPMLTTAIFSIAVMAIATIPESTAHLYQISLYADRLAEDQQRAAPGLDRFVGMNLVFDGIGDMLHGLFGAMAGTNYGENNSLMAITRNYSGPVLLAAGAMAIGLAFLGKLAALAATVPVFVSGGLALYLFGAIGMQGIALLVERRVDLFDPLQLAVGATIMVIGLGGNIGFEGGLLPVPVPGLFPSGLPAIATAAVVGIAMHLLFTAMRPTASAPSGGDGGRT